MSNCLPRCMSMSLRSCQACHCTLKVCFCVNYFCRYDVIFSLYFQRCSTTSYRLRWSQSCFNITRLSCKPVFTCCARCGMMHRCLQRGSGSRCVATMRCREILALPFSPKENHDGIRCVHVFTLKVIIDMS